MAAICSRCKGKNVQCRWKADSDGAAWTWITWIHECGNCDYKEEKEIRFGYNYEDTITCQLLHSLEVCVRVDCKCPFSPDYRYYPKDIIGLHRIEADDPRAMVGKQWVEGQEYCHGGWSSQSCEEENCNPAGEIVEVISSCESCSYKNIITCPLR